MSWFRKSYVEVKMEEVKPEPVIDLVAAYGAYLDEIPLNHLFLIDATQWRHHKNAILAAINQRAEQFAIISCHEAPTLGGHLYGTEILLRRCVAPKPLEFEMKVLNPEVLLPGDKRIGENALFGHSEEKQ